MANKSFGFFSPEEKFVGADHSSDNDPQDHGFFYQSSSDSTDLAADLSASFTVSGSIRAVTELAPIVLVFAESTASASSETALSASLQSSASLSAEVIRAPDPFWYSLDADQYLGAQYTDEPDDNQDFDFYYQKYVAELESALSTEFSISVASQEVEELEASLSASFSVSAEFVRTIPFSAALPVEFSTSASLPDYISADLSSEFSITARAPEFHELLVDLVAELSIESDFVREYPMPSDLASEFTLTSDIELPYLRASLSSQFTLTADLAADADIQVTLPTVFTFTSNFSVEQELGTASLSSQFSLTASLEKFYILESDLTASSTCSVGILYSYANVRSNLSSAFTITSKVDTNIVVNFNVVASLVTDVIPQQISSLFDGSFSMRSNLSSASDLPDIWYPGRDMPQHVFEPDSIVKRPYVEFEFDVFDYDVKLPLNSEPYSLILNILRANGETIDEWDNYYPTHYKLYPIAAPILEPTPLPQVLRLPGSMAHFVTTPHTDEFSFTDKIQLTISLRNFDQVYGLGEQEFISKGAAYRFGLTDGVLFFEMTTDAGVERFEYAYNSHVPRYANFGAPFYEGYSVELIDDNEPEVLDVRPDDTVITVVRSGTSVIFYVNGVTGASYTASAGDIVANDDPVKIGMNFKGSVVYATIGNGTAAPISSPNFSDPDQFIALQKDGVDSDEHPWTLSFINQTDTPDILNENVWVFTGERWFDLEERPELNFGQLYPYTIVGRVVGSNEKNTSAFASRGAYRDEPSPGLGLIRDSTDSIMGYVDDGEYRTEIIHVPEPPEEDFEGSLPPEGLVRNVWGTLSTRRNVIDDLLDAGLDEQFTDEQDFTEGSPASTSPFRIGATQAFPEDDFESRIGGFANSDLTDRHEISFVTSETSLNSVINTTGEPRVIPMTEGTFLVVSGFTSNTSGGFDVAFWTRGGNTVSLLSKSVLSCFDSTLKLISLRSVIQVDQTRAIIFAQAQRGAGTSVVHTATVVEVIDADIFFGELVVIGEAVNGIIQDVEYDPDFGTGGFANYANNLVFETENFAYSMLDQSTAVAFATGEFLQGSVPGGRIFMMARQVHFEASGTAITVSSQWRPFIIGDYNVRQIPLQAVGDNGRILLQTVPYDYEGRGYLLFLEDTAGDLNVIRQVSMPFTKSYDHGFFARIEQSSYAFVAEGRNELSDPISTYRTKITAFNRALALSVPVVETPTKLSGAAYGSYNQPINAVNGCLVTAELEGSQNILTDWDFSDETPQYIQKINTSERYLVESIGGKHALAFRQSGNDVLGRLVLHAKEVAPPVGEAFTLPTLDAGGAVPSTVDLTDGGDANSFRSDLYFDELYDGEDVFALPFLTFDAGEADDDDEIELDGGTAFTQEFDTAFDLPWYGYMKWFAIFTDYVADEKLQILSQWDSKLDGEPDWLREEAAFYIHIDQYLQTNEFDLSDPRLYAFPANSGEEMGDLQINHVLTFPYTTGLTTGGMGSPTIIDDKIISITGMDAGQIGSPTVIVGDAVISITSINQGAFGSVSVRYRLKPLGFGTTTFGRPRVMASVSPTSINSAEQFGSPAVFVEQLVDATSIAPSDEIGIPYLYTLLSPGSVQEGEVFGSTAVIRQQFITPGGIDGFSFGTHTVARGAIILSPTGYQDGDSFGTPVLATGGTSIIATGINGTGVFGFTTVDNTGGRIKVYKDGSFQRAPVRMWDGNTWRDITIKRWNGRDWTNL